MTDRAAVVAGLTEYANKPATSREVRAEAGEVFGARPLANLMRFAQTLGSREELNALIAEVAPLIRAEDRFRAGAVAISCGSLLEAGGDPGAVFPHLLAAMPRHLTLARRAQERKAATSDKLFADDPEAARAAGGLTYLLLCTMAVICRRMEFRQALRANPEVVAGIAALRETNREAEFVAQVLGYTDGVELLVLAPQEHKGFRVALEAVNCNFHLFTLLQATLIGEGHLKGDAPDPEVVAVARGESPHAALLTDHARWHFYTWGGLRADGTFAEDFTTWIPGDARPTDIPEFEGARVVLIGPPVLGSRAWDSNFFANIHDALRSRAEVVEVLPQKHVLKWLKRIQQSQR